MTQPRFEVLSWRRKPGRTDAAIRETGRVRKVLGVVVSRKRDKDHHVYTDDGKYWYVVGGDAASDEQALYNYLVECYADAADLLQETP